MGDPQEKYEDKLEVGVEDDSIRWQVRHDQAQDGMKAPSSCRTRPTTWDILGYCTGNKAIVPTQFMLTYMPIKE